MGEILLKAFVKSTTQEIVSRVSSCMQEKASRADIQLIEIALCDLSYYLGQTQDLAITDPALCRKYKCLKSDYKYWSDRLEKQQLAKVHEDDVGQAVTRFPPVDGTSPADFCLHPLT